MPTEFTRTVEAAAQLERLAARLVTNPNADQQAADGPAVRDAASTLSSAGPLDATLGKINKRLASGLYSDKMAARVGELTSRITKLRSEINALLPSYPAPAAAPVSAPTAAPTPESAPPTKKQRTGDHAGSGVAAGLEAAAAVPGEGDEAAPVQDGAALTRTESASDAVCDAEVADLHRTISYRIAPELVESLADVSMMTACLLTTSTVCRHI
eukprot:SAG31_NODE_2167_length_6269_cov_4.097731_4_plen_213_part_00